LHIKNYLHYIGGFWGEASERHFSFSQLYIHSVKGKAGRHIALLGVWKYFGPYIHDLLYTEGSTVEKEVVALCRVGWR